ncbi:hypothetical protein MGG_16641 [Pyricularia oryzae 70-15]|uniref:Uncharacterized protein n=1 Tax=Pyricularia oryzae (strain 70-15 / ATCC MYA-4617 / FGSC 8958) TaxID=242507 RepID=G4N174_PYRO7|nr:uncharacterized protein MGG_16641 [Pyricularia oryzae 70-15]EHA51553.1 hypothetical protein MGG_16641 [Pyricularia oryzae 70-15]
MPVQGRIDHPSVCGTRKRLVEACVEGFPLPFAPSKEGSGAPIVRDEKVDKPVILLQNKPLVAISAFL